MRRQTYIRSTVLIGFAFLSACQQTIVEPPENEPFRSTGTLSTDRYDVASAVAVGEQGEVFAAGVQAYGAVTPYGVGRGEEVRGFLNRYGTGEKLVWQTALDLTCTKRLPTAQGANVCAVRVADLEVLGADSYLLTESVSRPEVEVGRARSYVLKYDSAGKLLWQTALVSAAACRPLGLAVVPDGAVYALWQDYEALPDSPTQGTFAGLRLGRISASGVGEWFIRLASVPSYETGRRTSRYRDVADVAVLGETVLVAGFSTVQAFSLTGEPLWQTPLADAPTDTAAPEVGERFFARTEIVADGDRVYVGRSSLESRGNEPATAPRLELTALSSTGELLWNATLGDDATDVADSRLVMDSQNRLQVAGTVRTRGPEGLSAPLNFMDVYSDEGMAEERKQLGSLGSILDFANADGAAYLVGVTGLQD